MYSSSVQNITLEDKKIFSGSPHDTDRLAPERERERECVCVCVSGYENSRIWLSIPYSHHSTSFVFVN